MGKKFLSIKKVKVGYFVILILSLKTFQIKQNVGLLRFPTGW